MTTGLEPVGGLRLLPLESLIRTGPVDHAAWNYRPILGRIQRWRFHMILRLLPGQPVERLLEVGYGSGIFLPELSRHCRRLYGLDIHDAAPIVEQCLARLGIDARLICGSAESIPYPDRFFDLVVAVSSLEFIEHPEQAAREIRRVLKPDGRLIAVTPAHSRVADLGLRLLTGKNARREYETRRERLLTAFAADFEVERLITVPRWAWSGLAIYRGLRWRPRLDLKNVSPTANLNTAGQVDR